MAGRGGYRPGAGRPVGSRNPTKRVLYESPIRAAEQKISQRLPWLVDKLMELAEGIYEEKTIGDGAAIVYKRPPDRQAVEYLIDRVMGKATQPIDVYDAARRLAAERGLDPNKVVSIFDGLKKRRAV